MVNGSWLLNGEEAGQSHDITISENRLQCDPEESSVEWELGIALSELKRQINKVNHLLERGREHSQPPLKMLPFKLFDLNWDTLASCEYKCRRKRDHIFSEFKIFSEPAWDILLDLMIAENKGIRLPTSSVALGSGIPATTTLRWLSLLEDKGLVYREDDLLDGRRSFVRLSDLAVSLIKQTLAVRHDGASSRTVGVQIE